jgi:uncharacterized repeat protein (TIGR01451 family)
MARRQRRRRQERRRKHGDPAWTTKRSVMTGAGFTAGAVLGMSGVAHATDFTVTNLSDGADPGPAGSLRKAITDANTNPGPDNILFSASLSGRILLTEASIPITDALTINGPGADVLAVDAYYGLGRIFTINPTTQGDPVSISGLTLAYGHPVGSGGAIFNQDAKLTVADSLLYANSSGSAATGVGGGAIADAADYASGAQTTIVNSTVVGNSAAYGAGGGVASAAQLGTIRNSTIAGNTAATFGGGLLSANGGLLQDSTVAGNYAYGSGGGIDEFGSGTPHTTIENSLIGDNDADDSGPDLFGGVEFDAQFSLVENPGTATVNSTVMDSNLLGSDPRLPGYLTFSGGTTPTLLPAYDSPVIDQGMTAGGVTTDQRGLTRPFDLSFTNSAATGADGADMGAVELTVNETTPADLGVSMTDTPDPVTVGDPLNYAFHVANTGPEDATNVVLSELIPNHVSLSSLSGNCAVTGTDPDYGTYIDCNLGDLASGASATQDFTVTPQSDAASAGYITAYAAVSGDQVDPNTYNNFDYAGTVVQNPSVPPPPAPTPPTTTPQGTSKAAAIKRCKKKFRHNARKRKKCIKRAKRQAAASVYRRWASAPPVHPFTKRPRPKGIHALPTRSRLSRLTHGPGD